MSHARDVLKQHLIEQRENLDAITEETEPAIRKGLEAQRLRDEQQAIVDDLTNAIAKLDATDVRGLVGDMFEMAAD